ncbi:cysteine-rich secretory protein family domain-containing protein [Pochonia chlamydosporia 170]|uniref:Cysteine-rich secretory protein family domain-containing protein n=1 Tax=Pochonia chlamydosporia 170 TaxID=1380566 RepID=A0A179EXM0_METCM|nr:cysteine-rich secretory protein family domain-containing protein [Pochonia chlamydosporia 170]OAQ57669.1 cysteine-rich secretory protein family domain-containing protein [Pochonia chlamydosporia 170]
MACALVASRRVSSGQDVRLYGGARDGRVLNLGLQGKYEAAEREYERCHVRFPKQSHPNTTVCLSSEEKKLYDLIIAYRQKQHLESIPVSAKLSQVAQTHVRDLSEQHTFDLQGKCNLHTTCMWTKPQEIAGYKGNGFEIAYFNPGGATAQGGLHGWKMSPAHNSVLINSGVWGKSKWKAIGVGIYKGYGVAWFGEVDDVAPELCP